jgi:tRNA C32,U32 (ribose-2'-O)-methylase TrmJ
VLVQARNPLNILAAARAARNFGLGDIAVVDVQPRAWAEALEKDVDRETPHGPRGSSRGWLGDARKYDTLMEAIGDCNWVLGTSSLARRRTDPDEVIDLRELPSRITSECWAEQRPADRSTEPSAFVLGRNGRRRTAGNLQSQHATAPSAGQPGWDNPAAPRTPNAERGAPSLRTPASAGATPLRSRIAILFGSEKRGLTNDHRMHCQNTVWIPTAAAMPSMNLGQAVAVVCYELARSGVVGCAADAAGRKMGQEGAGIVKPSAKAAQDSPATEGARDSAYSTGRKPSDLAVAAGASGKARASELAEVAEFTHASTRSKPSELTKNKEMSKRAANAAEKQALLEQIAALVKVKSASSATSGIGTRRRNLCKLITRLPLSGDDVRLLLGVVKDARNASSASAERQKKPRDS